MNKEFRRFALFTTFGEGLALAWHLQREGNEVVVGWMDDLRNAGEKKKEPADALSLRKQQFNGMLDIKNENEWLNELEQKENKDEWFVIFDFNTQYKVADKVRKMGYQHGVFPTILDYKLESDREFAKQFVQKYYPGLRVAEVEEFKTIEEGLQFLQESTEFWALKGNDQSASTVVPRSSRLENAKAELTDALRKNKQAYESKGFLFERQIRDGLELCPAMIWNNGERVALTVDAEDKAFSPNEASELMGCAVNVIMEFDLESEIAQRCFPPVTDKLAQKHQGLFYLDANVIIKDNDFYFLEFCSQRFGYDAIFAECDMAGGVGAYFNALANSTSPYQKVYGVGTRGFAMKRDDNGHVQADIPLRIGDWQHVWPYGVKSDGGQILSVGGSYGDSLHGTDLVAITEASDDIDYAIMKLLQQLDDVSFNGMYARKDMDGVRERALDAASFQQPMDED